MCTWKGLFNVARGVVGSMIPNIGNLELVFCVCISTIITINILLLDEDDLILSCFPR